MKKLLLSVAFVTLGLGVSTAQDNAGGQTSKGKWLIEANTGNAVIGTTGIYISFEDGEAEYNIGLDGGYFVMDDLAVKVGLGYGDSSLERDRSVLAYRIGAKYYIKSMIPVSLDFTGASIEDALENPSYLGLGAGYAWFVGDNVSIEPGLRYNYSLNDDFYDSVFQLNIGFALHF